MTRVGFLTILLTLAADPVSPVAAQDLLWTRQTGTATSERGTRVTVDGAGNVYITGWTYGSLGGPSAGLSDALLIKYDASGFLLWTRQIGTASWDYGSGVAVDGEGNAYITGITQGSLFGPNLGGWDVFLAKYNASGTQIWTRQMGTASDDEGSGVAVDLAGNVYITGDTGGRLFELNAGQQDSFLAKYDASGTLLWAHQLGTSSSDFAFSVAVDRAGNAYITGSTGGSLAAPYAGFWDIFLTKYDVSGTLLWTRQIGTPTYDYAWGVAVDDMGNACIAGYTNGNLFGTNAGDSDAILAKYDASGALLWTRQIGTTSDDRCGGVVVDHAGNVYISGYTGGNLSGTNAGSADAFLAKYDPSGALLWTRQIGTVADEYGEAVGVDHAGKMYITGFTQGDLGGANAGGYDIFLAKFGLPTCPADFNHDGFLTGDDFDAFSLVFINGDAAADFDGNGFVNGDDFDGYVEAFEAGC